MSLWQALEEAIASEWKKYSGDFRQEMQRMREETEVYREAVKELRRELYRQGAHIITIEHQLNHTESEEKE